MSLDLELDDFERAVGAAVAQLCAERCGDDVVRASAGGFPAPLWRELAGLGVLALATPEGEGGAAELVAALESLGAAVFPGPLPATFFATQLLPAPERARVAAGEALVSLGAPPLMPFAPQAQIFLEVAGERVFRAEPRGAIDPVATLGGEPWGRVELLRREELAGAERAFALHGIAHGAYLAAAGLRLVRETAEHARSRRQFGRALGEFQAVAHPLADCLIGLEAAATLARAAAYEYDEDAAGAAARRTAAAARLSASRAALHAAYTCHQLYGAIGITLEGPAFHVTRRIRQLASQPPGEEVPRAALLEGVLGAPGSAAA